MRRFNELSQAEQERCRFLTEELERLSPVLCLMDVVIFGSMLLGLFVPTQLLICAAVCMATFLASFYPKRLWNKYRAEWKTITECNNGEASQDDP